MGGGGESEKYTLSVEPLSSLTRVHGTAQTFAGGDDGSDADAGDRQRRRQRRARTAPDARSLSLIPLSPSHPLSLSAYLSCYLTPDWMRAAAHSQSRSRENEGRRGERSEERKRGKKQCASETLSLALRLQRKERILFSLFPSKVPLHFTLLLSFDPQVQAVSLSPLLFPSFSLLRFFLSFSRSQPLGP